MRGRAVKDWCLCGLWLAAAAGMFLAALVPAESAPGAADCERVIIRLVPENPRPGQTVRVRIGVMPADYAPRAPGRRYVKQVAVDGGRLSAAAFPGPDGQVQRVHGPELTGELCSVRWTLPEEPARARIEVRVGGQVARAAVLTSNPGWSTVKPD